MYTCTCICVLPRLIFILQMFDFCNGAKFVVPTLFVIPQCTCAAVVMVVVLCSSAGFYIHTSSIRFHRVLYGVFKICIAWLSSKILCSKVLAAFADHLCLPYFLTSSQWVKETAMASFQEGQSVGLAIAPTTRLTHHWSQRTINNTSCLSYLHAHLYLLIWHA